MKKILIQILLLVISLNAFAELKPFTLKGEITNSKIFKYVYVFGNERKLVDKVEIIGEKFVLSGTYSTEQRFGAQPILRILLSDTDKTIESIDADRLLSDRRHFQVTVMCAENILLLYNADKKTFSISGSENNELENKFQSAYANFRNQRDSSNLSIDKLSLSESEKTERKEIAARTFFDNVIEIFASLISKNPDSEVSLFNFSPIIYDQKTSVERVQNMYDSFSERIKNSEYGLHVYADVEDKINVYESFNRPAYTIDMQFPDFSLPDVKGYAVGVKSALSKYTLIDFCATWCKPCRAETPNLINAYTNYQNNGFNIITISLDEEKDRDKWQQVLEQDKMAKFINLFNGNGKNGIARELKILTIPRNYLVDGTGKIIAMNLRGEELNKFLKNLYEK